MAQKLKTDQDAKIIAELRRDSRQSVRDIAHRTSLRPSTVHQHIKQLRSKGVIRQFTIRLNDRAVGENFVGFVLVKVHDELPPQVFAGPHVKEVYGITGEYDLLVKVKFGDIEEFNRFILTLRRHKAIESTLTMVGTLCLKEEI